MHTLPKILIVDDEPIIRNTLEGLLSFEDLQLLFAENGEIGLKMAQEFLPDAILLDVMMPGIDGYETCRRIRANPALAEIPVIMVTALDDREARLTGLGAGADDFLTKPFDGLEIQIRVKNIMRINRFRNLAAERSRFFWVVENDSKGYLILAENGNIVYANPPAQVYFHLPEVYHNINFAHQAERYYQPHVSEEAHNLPVRGKSSYLVQPESASTHAFWLRVEVLSAPLGVENQRLVRVSDVTAEMSSYHDIRQIHSLVAHKLRTPASTLYSSMYLLDASMDTAFDVDEVKSLVKTAWRGAERLMQSVVDILKYIDAPVSLVDGTPVSLGEIDNMVTDAGKNLELKALTVSIPEPLLKRNLGISTKAMDLIIYEIMENSKKFHPRQSPSVQMSAVAHGENRIELRFVDDGQAMTAEQLIRARQPYTQGEKWFTGEVPGMGLGIPLVLALVWQSGGEVHIENRSDQIGICVRIILPVSK